MSAMFSSSVWNTKKKKWDVYHSSWQGHFLMALDRGWPGGGRGLLYESGKRLRRHLCQSYSLWWEILKMLSLKWMGSTLTHVSSCSMQPWLDGTREISFVVFQVNCSTSLWICKGVDFWHNYSLLHSRDFTSYDWFNIPWRYVRFGRSFSAPVMCDSN